MSRTGERLATGFRGPVQGWRSLLPSAKRVLRLPDEHARLRQPDAAAARFDLIEITAFTESAGRIEDSLRALADRLDDDGVLLLDVENAQSSRALRTVLEGRPGGFEPHGSVDDPSQALPLRRVLAAAGAAGLHVGDVLAVPDLHSPFDAEFARGLFARGLLPTEWIDGAPPARFWLECRRQPPIAGSVVIAGGDADARRCTERALAAFLPGDWEIVLGEGVRECAQWNRGIAAARGELVWLLRAGAAPTEDLFDALAVQAGIGAAAPSHAGRRTHPGDLVGLMLPRNDLLLIGPVAETCENTRVAIEEHCMRLESKLPAAFLVDAELVAPASPVESPATLAAEVDRLVQRWAPVGDLQGGTIAPAAEVAAAPWSDRQPRVTLCMITRNEERFLGECLARARAAVDEIVIVDTGSTDRTVEIAESFGARVLHRPWDDDFSAPRNTALAAATGDWILVLDADEFLQDGGCERIREAVRDARVSGYHLHFVNVYGKGRTLGVMMVRLFRNLPGIEYCNVIHEQVTPSLQRLGAARGLVLTSLDVVVDHYGYTDEVMDQRGKNERNERLFKKQLALHPDDVYSLYKYGDFLRRVPGRGDDARAVLEQCLRSILDGPPTLPRELPYAGEVAALCALESARSGDNARARAVLDMALRRFLPTPNLHYISASLALADGRAEDAILHYRRCLAYRGQVLVVPIQEGITSYVSLAGIAQAWILRGELGRAQRLLEQAIGIEPSYEVAQLALSRIWLQRGDHQRALRTLTTFLARHPDSPGACQQTTLILHRLGLQAQARSMGRHAVRLLEARSLDREAAAMNEVLAAI